MMNRFIICTISIATLFFSFAKPTLANTTNHVLFINQVRGTECCEPGSLDNLKTQVETFEKYGIPAYFTLRYDAVINPSILEYLQSKHTAIKLGLFLEITPQLAKDAGVSYQGTNETWHQAHHAYTIGYSPEDRIKLLDHLFTTFYQQFGYYPELTTAWLIDTPSLNYIHDTYGVLVHQITREQFEIDSYTLWGGPPQYPYPAAEAWAFIPDYERSEAPLIVRQTLTDPLMNYGDTSSSFTSQPNDYSRDGKDFQYFKSLIDQAMSQPSNQPGFALLGLETSMPQAIQVEYQRQIGYIAELNQQGQVEYPTLEELSTFWTQRPINSYSGTNLVTTSKDIHNTNNTAIFITTPHYRIRMRQLDSHVFIDDIRIYSSQLQDPYTAGLAQHNGYWVVPFLLDGGRWYEYLPERTILAKLFGPPNLTSSLYFPTSQDTNSSPTRLDLPMLKDSAVITIAEDSSPSAITVTYTQSDGQPLTVSFSPTTTTITPTTTLQYHPFTPPQYPVQYVTTEQGWSLKWVQQNQTQPLVITQYQCTEHNCQLNFQSDATQFQENQKTHYPFLFPEKTARPISAAHSKIFVHNRYAIAGRNPIRVVIVPFDELAFPTIIAQPPVVTTQPAIDVVGESTTVKNEVTQFIDLSHNAPLSTSVTVKLNAEISMTQQIYFAPNCKAQIGYCLRHPQQAWWYIQTLWQDFIAQKLQGE